MGDYIVKCLKKQNATLDGKVLLTLLKPVYKARIKLKRDLFNAQKILEASLRNAVKKALGNSLECDYALITDDAGKVEVLIPMKAESLQYASVLSPRPALLKGIQILKRQEYVEMEANAVFSRSLLNLDVPLTGLEDAYVYEGEVGVSKDIDNVVALRIITDKGTRVILNNEISRVFEAPKTQEGVASAAAKVRRASRSRPSRAGSKSRKRRSRRSTKKRTRKKRKRRKKK